MTPPREFFVDENLGERFRAGLHELGLIVRTHEDIDLPRGAKDFEWILPVGKRGWPAFTLDTKLGRNNPLQIKLIRAGKLADFRISNKKPSPDDHLQIVRKHLNLILVVAGFLPRPYRVGLTKSNANLFWWGESAESVFREFTDLPR